ncbi:unnamed protein product [Pleuronectes platessa]|uniref:Uncharacterized protein n=1 Tax=Pleuronectes platessa TaxID=8262 RepID=A0A9N7UET4_PLEPL|nr:unnamed protein product [Pleuronectes platessa]
MCRVSIKGRSEPYITSLSIREHSAYLEHRAGGQDHPDSPAQRASTPAHKASVTDLRKPVAATPPQRIMCLCVWLRRFLVLPGTTLPVRTAKVFNMGEERRRSAFHSASTSGASPGLEDDGAAPCHWLSWLAVWPVTSRPDRSVKKEEEMFLYLECGHFISRIYSRSNTRITSRCSVTSLYKHTFSISSHNTLVHYVTHYKLSLKGQAIPATQQLSVSYTDGKRKQRRRLSNYIRDPMHLIII